METKKKDFAFFETMPSGTIMYVSRGGGVV